MSFDYDTNKDIDVLFDFKDKLIQFSKYSIKLIQNMAYK